MLAGQTSSAGATGPAEAVDTFFAALNSNDAALAATVMLRDGQLSGHAAGPDGARVTHTKVADYLDSMAARGARVLERTWDVEVRVHGGIATVWTPYDFWLDGRLHHCGVNSFSLVRFDDGWKIAGIVYSVETESCGDSPLGPPTFD